MPSLGLFQRRRAEGSSLDIIISDRVEAHGGAAARPESGFFFISKKDPLLS
jgi:hypothetical protein